ncbi:MAG: DsbA family protein [Archangiaceae bacterium]|nr:DsbA family protein [Archangiaceae bacterium]
MADRFAADYGILVDWQPYLLRPDAPAEGWSLPEHIRERMNRPDNPLTLRARQLGLPLKEREWIPNSRRALAANEFVRKEGLEALHRFHSAVNDHYWARGEDLSHWSVLEAAAKDIGVDGTRLRDAVEQGDYSQQVNDSIAAAHRLGINAVPTYVFFDGDRPLGAIQGAQEYAVFERAAKQLGIAKKT